MTTNIRQETKDDFSEVFKAHQLAFGQNIEANLVELLRQSNAFIPELSLVATIDSKIVGHILFSRIVIIGHNQIEFESLALAPVAVRPDFQNKGIGGQLINNGLKIAKELGYMSVIVLGHKEYYPKFGFVPAIKWNILSPYDVPTNHFMAIELVKDGLKNVSGLVKYAKEFENL